MSLSNGARSMLRAIAGSETALPPSGHAIQRSSVTTNLRDLKEWCIRCSPPAVYLIIPTKSGFKTIDYEHARQLMLKIDSRKVELLALTLRKLAGFYWNQGYHGYLKKISENSIGNSSQIVQNFLPILCTFSEMFL